MKAQEKPIALWVFAAMLVIILDSNTAIQGAKESMELILYTLIPSLFPFFFLSIWLTSTSSGLMSVLFSPLARMIQLPQELSGLLIPAFLGGYPSGAQAVAEHWEQGKLSTDSAERLLGFCSNAGPSFLFGIIAPMFPEKWVPWTLWFIHIIGAICATWILPPVDPVANFLEPRKKSLPEILKSSISVMAQVSGWVILFRILIAFLNRWIFWALPDYMVALLSGFLELTNGCCILRSIENWHLRFFLCSVMLSLGGCCITMQTHSVSKSLNMRYYYQGKCIQTSVSVCLAAAFLNPMFIPAALIPAFLLFRQKRYSIPQASGV